jgi:dihydroorotase
MCDTTGDLPAPSDGEMLEGFEILARHGIRCPVHAENASILEYHSRRLQAAGRDDPHAHLDARPAVAAIEAVGRAITFAEWTGARLHIAHKSSGDALCPNPERKKSRCRRDCENMSAPDMAMQMHFGQPMPTARSI